MEPEVGYSLVINRPEWFQRDDFMTVVRMPGVMTWHHPDTEPSEYSDVCFWVDPSLTGEGSEADIVPSDIWNEIIALCTKHFQPSGSVPHIAVRVANLL